MPDTLPRPLSTPPLHPTTPPPPRAAEVRRVLHLVFVVDCSGSMSGERIGSLNYAVRTAIPAMQAAAADHPEAEVLVRVLRFADLVDWVMPHPVPVAQVVWSNLAAGGETSMGAALHVLADALSAEPDMEHALPPVIVLLSDGLASDDAAAGIEALLSTELGAKAVRIPIAIGPDADLDLLQAFIADPALRPLRANTAEMLASRIRWASSVPVAAVSAAATAALSANVGPSARAETAAKAADDLLW